MKARCKYPTASGYKHYGARGIRVCKAWQKSFIAFRDWALANGYANNLSIDRRDNNSNYEPGNCHWVKPKLQGRNQRSNRPVIRSDGRFFPTVIEGAEATPGALHSSISCVCRGKRMHHAGYGWKYAEQQEALS
jgi:hypothetical protein